MEKRNRMSRSDPLIIDKETGEPINPPFTHEKYEAWKVLIVNNATGKRQAKKFFSYVEARATAKRLQEKYGERATVGVVSRQLGYGPPESRVPDEMLLKANNSGKYWCPYCRTWREFHYVPALEVRWCEFCQMPEHDFHTRRCNPLLWDPVHFKRVFG